MEWLLREIVNVPKDTIAEATITSASGEVLHLSRAGKDFRIDGMPEGRKVKSQYSVNNAATVVLRPGTGAGHRGIPDQAGRGLVTCRSGAR